MAPQTIRDLCEVAAEVAETEVEGLALLGERLDLLADLAAADVGLLAPGRQRGELVVLAEGRPTVCRALHGRPRAGEIVPAPADPLAARCLQSGRAQRGRHVYLVAGRPVKQTVLPVRPSERGALAVLSLERSAGDTTWQPLRKPLRRAAHGLAAGLLDGLLRPDDLLRLLRMASHLIVTDAEGDVLFADDAALELWRDVVTEERHLTRLSPGPLPGATLLSHAKHPWGSAWELEIGDRILRRRDLPLGGPEAPAELLVTIHDVSSLHSGQWLVSARSAAIQEIHHRIKNNLQTISSLLRMQSRRETSVQAKESLRTAIGRVQSVAFVHEALSRDGPDEVDLKSLASALAEAAVHGAQREGGALAHVVLGEALMLPAAKASQVALVLNELIQNAVKHAFPGDRAGTITIRLQTSQEAIAIEVEDDGVGLPPGFDVLKTQRLGLQIARTIVESDLAGRLEVSGGEGTKVTLTLPPTLAHGGVSSR